MKKFKIVFILICVVLTAGVFTIAGCGGNDDTDKDNPGIVETVEVKVVFEDWDGVDTQTVNKGEKVKEPKTPVRTGYIFDGWFNEKGQKYDFTQPVTQDIKLVARWTPKQTEDKKITATLKYENGMSDGTIYATKEKTGWFFKQPETPSKKGFVFDGWYTAKGEKFDFTKPATENIVLTARWTAGSIEEQDYTATLKYGNGTADGTLHATKTNGDWLFAEPTEPFKSGFTFDGWFTESGEKYNFTQPVTQNVILIAHWIKDGFTATLVYNNGAENGLLAAVKDGDAYYFEKPTDPDKAYNAFDGWFTDSECTVEFDFNSEITKNITLYAKWSQAYDTVVTEWDFVASASVLTDNPLGIIEVQKDTLFQSKFMLGATAYFEIGDKNSVNIKNGSFEFYLDGAENKNTVEFSGQWTDAVSGSFKIIDAYTQTEVYNSGNLTVGSGEFTETLNNLPAGNYSVISTGNIKFHSFKLTDIRPQGPTYGIELDISSIQTRYLWGKPFNSKGIYVKLAYESGRKDEISLSDCEIVVPDNFTQYSGKKTIIVKYHLNDSTVYSKSFVVDVCAPEYLVLYDHVIDENGRTGHIRTLFDLNSKLTVENLVVKAKCLLPETNDTFIEFLLDESDYTVQLTDTSTFGSKTITVTYKWDTTKFAEFTIDVIDVPNLSKKDSCYIKVDPDAHYGYDGNIYTVDTINRAMEFIKLCKIPESATKTIALKATTVYREKVEIDVKNVILTTYGIEDAYVSAFENNFNYSNSGNLYDSFAVIEFDAIGGKTAPSENSLYGTDGSATVSIRPEAENFIAKFVTFKNYYNTAALYEDSKSLYTDTTAVAALVQADKASFYYCKFTSYHTTLFAQTGRQYYNYCLIEGHTDYISGYNATAYFDTCLIRSVGAGIANNGGYIVRAKGFNQSVETDGIKYGLIFNNCEFTADEATADGSVTIARTWGENMRTMVMNSVLSSAISLEAYGEITPEGKNMNDRYSKVESRPNPDYIYEYNNTGDGAIQSGLAYTCSVVTEETAENFGNLDVVFGAENGNLTYTDAWNPTK